MVKNGSNGLKRRLAKAAAIAAVLAGTVNVRGAFADGMSIITFGTNTPEWNKKLNLSAVRMGCNLTPGECAKRAAAHAKSQGVKKIFIAIDPVQTAEDYASEYNKLSAENPLINEIGFDDFGSAYYNLWKSRKIAAPDKFLDKVTANAKAGGSNLKFGVTLYETDLKSPFLRDPKLPAAVRARFDSIHLYLHHRGNGKDYASYVAQAKELFPNAAIIAGSYPFDRIDYAKCLPGGEDCNKDDEIGLYKVSMEIQAQLLKEGQVTAIEFYPAEFGREESWGGWNNPRFCKPDRKAECIENTKAMRKAAVDALTAHGVLK